MKIRLKQLVASYVCYILQKLFFLVGAYVKANWKPKNSFFFFCNFDFQPAHIVKLHSRSNII